MEKKPPRQRRDNYQLHWWDDHPSANPVSEPLYAEALMAHVAQVS